MSSFPFLLEQVYTFDFLIMLLGCKARCLCIQTSQVLSHSVVLCSWWGLWSHLPSRCARTWGCGGFTTDQKKENTDSPAATCCHGTADAGLLLPRDFLHRCMLGKWSLSRMFGPDTVLQYCHCPAAPFS